MNFLGQGFRKSKRQNRQTTGATECITTPHLLVVIIKYRLIFILYYANRQQIEHTDNQHKRIEHDTSYEVLNTELRNELRGR